MAIDERILSALRGGFTDGSTNNLDADEQRHLRSAFFEGYQKQLGYAELGGCAPAYFVAELEAQSLDNLARQKRFELLASATIKEYNSVSNTWLVPAATTTIECQPIERGVRIKASIAEDTFDTMPDDQTVYVFCSSQSPDQLRAFRYLAEGRWGDEFDSNPSFGLGNSINYHSKSTANKLTHIEPAGLASLIESLFFHTKHPLSSTFIRISKQALRCMSSGRGLEISTGHTTAQFENLKLKLNCVPFWNQQIRYISGSDIKRDLSSKTKFRIHHDVPYTDNSAQLNVRILSCKDVRGHHYFSSDTIGFSLRENGYSANTMEVKQSNQNGRLSTVIEFPESCNLGDNDLSIVYAYNQASAGPPKAFKVAPHGLRVLLSEISDVGEGPWQNSIHPEVQRLVTRSDLRQYFKRFAPLVLQDSLQEAECDQIRILTQLRRIPTRLQSEYGTARVAVPTVVIGLNVPCPVANEDLKQHYTGLWEQRIEERCPAGTIIKIEWKDDL